LGMNPEFLREGEAVEDFQNPDRIVLGAIDTRSADAMARLYAGFSDAEQIRTNPQTAEMIKYASNSLLATLISFSNEIGNLCSAASDVDVVDVLGAVHLDKRISPVAEDRSRIVPSITAYLRAGCGFGGSCFPKDVRALIRWGKQHHRPVRLLTAVLETNEAQSGEVVTLLKKHFPELAGVRVAVLGLAFKAGTDDIRESPALRVVPALAAEGAHVIAYDPVAMPAARLALPVENVQYAESLTGALESTDAVVLLTAWPEFQQLPELLAAHREPPVVVDGRRVFEKTRVRRYEGIGLGATAFGDGVARNVRKPKLKFEPTPLTGAWILDLEPRHDERGFFARTWCRREFEERGLSTDLVQANLSHNTRKGTIRGMHYQVEPFGEVKLIRCIRGAIWDVIIDLKPQSPTYMQWFGVELSAENRRQLYIPKNFAHGYQTLVDDAEVIYHVSEVYVPAAERGIRWDDPSIRISWPQSVEVTISSKDRSWPDFTNEHPPSAAALPSRATRSQHT
jgi:dTDP-4-dehydrorhamnose 3,5-epimerase